MMMTTSWLLNEVGANMQLTFFFFFSVYLFTGNDPANEETPTSISRVLEVLNSIEDGTMYGSWTLLCAASRRS